MLYLVVNGDDLGYSKPRNNGIVRCFNDGIVTSTSLLINGDAVEHAVHLVKKYNIPTGLHMNLSEGVPLTEASSLVDKDGYMLGKYGIRDIHKKGKIDFQEVEQEMQAQIDKFESLLGGKPSHIDGHQHVHVLPGMCEIFCKVLNKNGVNVTRLPIEDIRDKHMPEGNFLQTVIEDSYIAKAVLDRFNIRYTDKFIGLYSSDLSVTSVSNILLGMTNGCSDDVISCELMVHPGYMTEQEGGCGCEPDDFSQSHLREKEMDFLCDEKLKQFIYQSNIKLSTFSHLTDSIEQ